LVLPALNARLMVLRICKGLSPLVRVLLILLACKKGVLLMRNPFFSCVLVVLLLVPVTSHAKQPVILIIGDSLSAAYGIERHTGWVQLLQQRLAKKGYPYQVVNASISGNTTRSGLARLPAALKQHQPEIVIIELGGNDGLQGLSIEEFRTNLSLMTSMVKKQGAKVLLCGVRIPPNLGSIYGSKFEAVYRDVAEKHRVSLVKYILKGISENGALMQEDGVHPTAGAQPLILENIWQELHRLIT
jgi:acyl-CoA thioesterase-1